MKITRNISGIRLVLYLLLLLCVWAIIAVQFNVTHLTINVNWAQEMCANFNQLYINLSYSFLAAYIFYLLTIYFPQKIESRRLEPVIKQKVLRIRAGLGDILLEFSRDTGVKNYTEIGNARVVLNSKNWNDFILMHQLLYKADTTYLAYIGEKGEVIQKNIVELIQSYQRFLTAEQMCLLEDLCQKYIFRFAQKYPKIQMSETGIKSLIDMFIEALNKMDEIEKSFSIKDK